MSSAMLFHPASIAPSRAFRLALLLGAVALLQASQAKATTLNASARHLVAALQANVEEPLDRPASPSGTCVGLTGCSAAPSPLDLRLADGVDPSFADVAEDALDLSHESAFDCEDGIACELGAPAMDPEAVPSLGTPGSAIPEADRLLELR